MTITVILGLKRHLNNKEPENIKQINNSSCAAQVFSQRVAATVNFLAKTLPKASTSKDAYQIRKQSKPQQQRVGNVKKSYSVAEKEIKHCQRNAEGQLSL
ncbi:unnamed protein product [Parnassius apollo]|uniref:(apollo) hypothetical protein n=1 Tax=Parnassius apollo TaxID=110799 RepID=A0A8S3WRY7_PARAO|nr:unnamed protein product [Parnassius apollo]